MRVVREREDYDICAEACNEAEAIDLAKKCAPDLVILDLSMPVMDGLQAARKLRQLMPEVPLILFTRFADSTILAVPELPLDSVVSKSDGATLRDKVRALVPA